MKFKKSLGQNFLSDIELLKSIVNEGDIIKDDIIVEIGPGTGNLTNEILKKKTKKINSH